MKRFLILVSSIAAILLTVAMPVICAWALESGWVTIGWIKKVDYSNLMVTDTNPSFEWACITAAIVLFSSGMVGLVYLFDTYGRK